MPADLELLTTQIRDLHNAFDLGQWEPSPVEHACAARILEAVASRPLDDAIVHALRAAPPGGTLPEDSYFASTTVSCAVYFRRSVAPTAETGQQVHHSFLDLLRKITGDPAAPR
ncbi:hypothetical protein K4B79_18025 [Streptomyces lincolnensis]|uniref:hypothetical protein n=1 Tax=Streptomyces lincolnensis TaxID=1915 RepID=UPI001E301ED8|nr:hypothetical protein [Streptomyces lincolnensis]MCD7440114.1 hypothetical protein [Streptomyces lincolnensis]